MTKLKCKRDSQGLWRIYSGRKYTGVVIVQPILNERLGLTPSANDIVSALSEHGVTVTGGYSVEVLA